jgi:hypothetical protein
VRLDAVRHVLLLNLHHIAADGWSLGILANELAALYPAFAARGARHFFGRSSLSAILRSSSFGHVVKAHLPPGR